MTKSYRKEGILSVLRTFGDGESNDNTTDASNDRPVPGRAGRGHLLHARDYAARHGGTGRGSSCSVDGAEDHRTVRGSRVMADTVCLNAILHAHAVPRACHLMYANLPRLLAGGPPV